MANIFQQYLQPAKSVMDYTAEMDQADARKNALQQAAMALQNEQMKLDSNRRDVEANNALSRLVAQGAKPEDIATGLAQQGFGKQSLAYTKQQQDLTKSRVDTDTSQFKLAKERYDTYNKVLGSLANDQNLTKDSVVQAGQSLVQQGIIPQEVYASAVQNLPDDVNQLRTKLKVGLSTQLTPEQMMTVFAPKPDKIDNGQQIIYRDTNPNSPTYGQVTGGAPIQKQQTPDSIAARAQAERHFQAQQAGNDGEATITPSAIDNAAARYNIDGTLPPMGMGKTGAAGRTAILNRAAELAAQSGVSPDDQRITQIGNKANSAALSKLQQQQTMVGAFEKNFNKNADIALEYSGKVDRTGVPIANKWINAGKRSIAGDPDLAAYDQAIKAVSNEYAKIISGSMGNTAIAEGEIKKVESLLNSAQTPEQVTAVINLMKRETQNRMAGFEEQKTELRHGMSGRKPAAAAAASTSANAVVTPDGVTHTFPSPAAAAAFKKAAGL